MELLDPSLFSQMLSQIAGNSPLLTMVPLEHIFDECNAKMYDRRVIEAATVLQQQFYFNIAVHASLQYLISTYFIVIENHDRSSSSGRQNL